MLLGDLPEIKKLLPAPTKESLVALNNLKKFEVVQAFHITHFRYRESILRYGLQPAGHISSFRHYNPRIFFSTTVEDLPWGYVGDRDCDIWTFCVPIHLVKPDEIADSINHYYTEEPVPFYKLHLYKSIINVYKWGMETP